MRPQACLTIFIYFFFITVVFILPSLDRNEGPLGFYKGMVPNLIRVTPACCITFLTYEKVSGFLLDQHK